MLLSKQGKAMLRLHEGSSLVAYSDSRGIRTIGVGHNMEAEPFFERKLIPNVIDEDYQERLFDYDIMVHENRLLMYYPWVQYQVDPVRRDVLINMTFNIRGFPKVFPTFFKYIKNKEYTKAAQYMKTWPWYKQVGSRAVTLCHLMETGEYV